MFNYKTLENVDIDIIHQAFINAFSDYQVKIDLPLWKLQQMLQRRGFIPDKSMGAFDGEVLVGFILNGFREWKLKEFWDIQPSWQNSIESICALKDAFVYSVVRTDSKIVGYGIIDKRTGDIPQISVNRNCRNKGIARSIVTDLINNTESDKVVVINVDDRSKVSKDFLSALGFECYVEQYEMILEINA